MKDTRTNFFGSDAILGLAFLVLDGESPRMNSFLKMIMIIEINGTFLICPLIFTLMFGPVSVEISNFPLALQNLNDLAVHNYAGHANVVIMERVHVFDVTTAA